MRQGSNVVLKFRKFLFSFGGYAFWSLLVLWLAFALLAKGCSAMCSDEVVEEIPSPDGRYVVEVSIGDCGGATTDFYGKVIVKHIEKGFDSRRVFGFEGRPSASGLAIEWQSDDKLVLSFDNLQKVRSIDPNGRKTSDFQIVYKYRGHSLH
ncbi:hypothetical protein [uncultured Shewanella sp.]|uniref:hypothetical protein n=1 Tax=uncultured Shewanella sp. TaxID=173975 RepID=UPI00262DDB9F|nr:hypothetical protein [uncultured Shewanella sp.]